MTNSRTTLAGCVALLFSTSLAAQAPGVHRTPAAYLPIERAVAAELSGDRALATVAYVEQFFRLPGNRGFDASLDSVARLLEAAGYVEERSAAPGARLTYRMESRPMRGAAWSPLDASVSIVGRVESLETWRGNHNMLGINSRGTPDSGVTAPLVYVGQGTGPDFAGVDVKGKIVLGDGSATELFQRAVVARGALGVLATQKLPDYNRPEVNRTAIQFRSIARDASADGWGIFLSREAYDRLKAAVAAGPVSLHVVVKVLVEQRPERTLVAEIRGSTAPDQRMVYSAHVQEPGANDNASGVGALAEMARVAAVLVRNGTADPGRTLTFLWGNEIQSTQRYITEDSTRRQGIKWGMSLDMVGENTALTGGTFLIEKMPDPSAVWVRGEDQHTEWGGRPLPVSSIWPYWYNDFVKQRCLDRSAATGGSWVVRANPFEGGSDHTPFLTARIPGLLMWHFTDQYYHTDRDRLEMVSAATLANVGNCALSIGLILTAHDHPDYVRAAIEDLTGVAVARLAAEAKLSRAAIASGGKPELERTILTAWRDYYLEALDRVPEMALPSAGFSGEIAKGKAEVQEAAARALKELPTDR